MAKHCVTFGTAVTPVMVPTGTLLTEAARRAGLDIAQPCGGQGRCGRCAVRVQGGAVRRRSTLRLSAADVAQGYALACQAVVEGDVAVSVPPPEAAERHLSTDLTAVDVAVPLGYDPHHDQTLRRLCLTIPPPTLQDQTDDWRRLHNELCQQTGLSGFQISLPLLQCLGGVLRQKGWQVTAVIDARPPPEPPRLVALLPGHMAEEAPLWGMAVDIGTTTVTVWLVDVHTGQVGAQAAEYNRQVTRGEDVISRIIYASKNHDGAREMRQLVLESINTLVQRAVHRLNIDATDIFKATIAGNSTMMHLLLGLPAATIRLQPFVTAVNHLPLLCAQEVGLHIHPEAAVDCLPGVASYVGADITAGVLAAGVDDGERVSLFLDVGTNGETVLGSRDWLVTCACSAGPAFEGAGVHDGMRATRGAIEEVWINSQTFEPTVRVIGSGKPQGLCGSGLICLLAELFVTGLVDKAGHLQPDLPTDRVRHGAHGWEYVVVWGQEAAHGRDLVITHADINNLLRAKGAIYAGFTVLADSVGFSLAAVEQVLVGGAFGQYINVEKAIQIGLLPDMPWGCFRFLGNTAVKGAYLALLDHRARARISHIAARMTYIELSADNSFYDAFTAALFLPHTDLSHFPSVWQQSQAVGV